LDRTLTDLNAMLILHSWPSLRRAKVGEGRNTPGSKMLANVTSARQENFPLNQQLVRN